MKRSAIILILIISVVSGKMSGQCLVVTDPPAVCSPAKVDLTAASVTAGSTATTITYWQDATCTTTELSTPSSVDAGIYYIKGEGGPDCTAPVILPVTATVNPLPAVTFTAQPGAGPYCTGIDVTYTTQSSMTDYTWVFPGGCSVISGGTALDNSATVRYSSSGSKVVTVNYSDGGCSAATSTSSIATTINALPSVSFSSQPDAGPFCTGVDVTYTTQSSMSNYLWVFPGDATLVSGGTTASNSAIVRYTTTGTKIVTVNYTEGGCTADSPASSTGTTVNNPPVVSFTAAPGAGPVCTGTSVTYTTQASKSNYVWVFPGSPGSDYTIVSGGTSTSSSAVIRYLSAGSKIVTVNYTDGGCSAVSPASSVATTVQASSSGGSISADQTICYDSQPNTIIVSSYTGLILRWESSPNNGFGTPATIASTSDNLLGSVVGNLTSDTYFRAVIQSGSCSIAYSPVIKVTVNGNKSAGIIGGSSTVCYGNAPGTFTATGSGGGGSFTYQWYRTPATLIDGATNPSYSPGVITASTGYYCILTTPSCGTISTSVANVTVLPLPTLTGVSQASPVCSGNTATINLTGLPSGSTSMVSYSVNGVAQPGITGLVATGTSASFFSESLAAASNGKILSITGITTTSSVPNCSANFTTITSTLIVNTATTPTISGPVEPCLNGVVRNYTTEPGMSAYNWIIPAGQTISGGGTASDNFVNVIWNTPGSKNVSVSYTNTSGCPSAAPAVRVVNVNALPVPVITGPASVCLNSAGNVYVTQPGMPEYDWEINGGTITSGGDGSSISVVTWNTAGPRTISVNYSNSNSCWASAPTVYNVSVNALPSPALSGPSPVRVTSIGNVYSTDPGMSGYVWNVSPGGTITAGGNGNPSVTVTWNTSGPQYVNVNYINTNNCTAAFPVTQNVTVNPLPVASGVSITGSPSLGTMLTAHYTYTDVSPEGASIIRWLRNGTEVIAGAISVNYTLINADLDKTITFEITPVSSAGTPNTGLTVRSAATLTVEDLSGVPVAAEVCIEGIREAGSTIRGVYKYDYHSKPEGSSLYKWYRNSTPIAGANEITYVLDQVLDIDSNADIWFEVTPVSSTHTPKAGLPVKSSAPLARVTLPKNIFSKDEPDIVLTANVMGGIFSGPGVTAGTFSPKNAGVAGSPHTIEYLLNIVNPSHSCSQKSSEIVTVSSTAAIFNGVNAFYCHDGGEDIITVTGFPGTATDKKFWLSNPAGMIDTSGNMIKINPGFMRPGVNIDTLYFSYKDGASPYIIKQALVIDSVGSSMKIRNLLPAYCIDHPEAYLSVEGVYPPGGRETWTGSILTTQTAISANVKPSLGTAGLTYPITYRYRSPIGCYGNLITDSIKINGLPDPSFALDATYNIEGDTITLIPAQAGGTFSGKTISGVERGVSGNKLYPRIAKLGSYYVTYKITDINNCTATRTDTTLIREASGTFTGFPSDKYICYRDTTYNIRITDLPGSFLIIKGFTNSSKSINETSGADNVSYSVPDAGAGPDTLVFSYSWEGVDYSISKIIFIDSLGQEEIKPLYPGIEICKNENIGELYTIHDGGDFEGPVTGGYFDTSKATGDASVTYRYKNQDSGCSVYVMIPVTIHPIPDVSFIPSDVCIQNESDTTFFSNKTTSSDPVESWKWEFFQAGQPDPEIRSVKEPGYLYKEGGLYRVSLTATTIYNCSVTKVRDLDMGFKPAADFIWKKDCMHVNDSIELFDATLSPTPIVSRSWEFATGAPIYKEQPKYLKTGVGYLPVRYIVNTNYLNCSDTVFKNIYIRPSIPIPADGYLEDFENGTGGWVKDDTSSFSWNFGTPDKQVINNAASGVNAWFTGDSLTNQKTGSASVVSPCFDFTASARPMISLKIRTKFDRERDGAVLQYQSGNSDAWLPVGTIDDGINWFNSPLIKGSPGGDQIGWTTKDPSDTAWREARHTLNELSGLKDVKFRIAYGSDGNAQENEGIAFDDIRITERSRNVLLEHFTNASSDDSRTANEMVNRIALKNRNDIINIQYHTNFPGADPFYDNNPGDVSSRIVAYGLTKAPYSFIDGGTGRDFARISDYMIADIDSNDVIKRSLVNPRFKINIDPVVNGNVLSVAIKITALEDIDNINTPEINNLTLFIAITEQKKEDHTSTNVETVFYNVFRKFIPDAGGLILKTAWTRGESLTLPAQQWAIDNIINTRDIDVIAFIQDLNSKEVLQAVWQEGPDMVVGIEKPLINSGMGFSLYPNPAKDKITVIFADPLPGDADIRIYDIHGVVVRSFRAGSGSYEYVIDNPGLRGGIYMIRITAGSFEMGFKKLIVTND